MCTNGDSSAFLPCTPYLPTPFFCLKFRVMKVDSIEILPKNYIGGYTAIIELDCLSYRICVNYKHYTEITEYYTGDYDLTPLLSKEVKKTIFLALREELNK